MTIPWGQHLELARCIEGIGEHDLAIATTAMAGALHLLQCDLCLMALNVELDGFDLSLRHPDLLHQFAD